MSIELSWSANSLQEPVHAHLAKINRIPIGQRGIDQQRARLEGRVLAPQRPGPEKGPWAVRAQNALEQSVLNASHPGAPFPVTNKLGTVDLSKPATTPPSPTDSPVKVTQPGISPEIATAIPEPKTDGVPKVAPISGWLSPGANFQIR